MAITMEVPKEAATKKEVLEPPSMELADEVTIEKEVLEEVKPVPKEEAPILALAVENAKKIWHMNFDEFTEREEYLRPIESFGADSMKSSAANHSLLHVAVGKVSKEGDEGGTIAKGLLDLQRELKGLDPSLIDFTRDVGDGILGKLFDPVRDYFAKYQKADEVIKDIIISLNKGKMTLKNDITTLQFEQKTMIDLTKKLMKEIQLGTLMDEAIEKEIEVEKARNEDQEKIIFVNEEVLFPLRQRVMDMQTMTVVNQQGIMATEIVIRNNKELMRGVERAINVTIPALRNSVMISFALYNQMIVLKKIKKLNETTNNIIITNGDMLKKQGVEIQKKAMEVNISIETLKAAYADAKEALDSISDYKKKALLEMRKNINQLEELDAKGKEQIQKLEKGHKLGL